MKNTFIPFLFVLLSYFNSAAQSSEKTYKKFQDTSFHAGDVIITPEISFVISSCAVKPVSNDSVAVIAAFLKKHPSFKIEIGVHTESRGLNELTMKVCDCRANQLLTYLTQTFDIPKDRLTTKGYGSTEPLVSDFEIRQTDGSTTEGSAKREKLHRKNQRVEIKILSTSATSGQ